VTCSSRDSWPFAQLRVDSDVPSVKWTVLPLSRLNNLSHGTEAMIELTSQHVRMLHREYDAA
jgi:hypothetical protein